MKSIRLILPVVLIAVTQAFSAPAVNAAETHRARYERQKYGLFVHYVPELTTDAKGNKPRIDELAKRFDAVQFAKDAADFGVEYVIFTVWHFRACTLYPSAVNKRWRDDRRAPGGSDPKNTKTYSDIDLIDALATALEARGIDLHLYVHPNDGHDFSDEDADLTGWNEKSGESWNNYQNELFDELGRRYGTRIKGYWFDALFKNKTEQTRLRRTIEARNPGMALVGNVASGRSRPLSPGWAVADYRAWECGGARGNYSLENVNPHVLQEDTDTWPCTSNQVAMIVGGNWWAANPKAPAKSDPENLYRYLVLQASISNSGGFAISAGCFPDGAAQNHGGNIWEGNFHEVMTGLGRLVEPVAASIKNTVAGKAFVTPERARIEKLDWGVSTESPDGKTIYLHVLNPPRGKTLLLGHTEDGSVLDDTAVILKSGQAATLVQKRLGHEIHLPENASWDPLDTVIQLQRK